MAACHGGSEAAAGPFQFTRIASSTAVGGAGLSVPSINNFSDVAFVDTSPGHVGVFIGDGGPLTTIATAAQYDLPYFAGSPLAPSINNSSSVAFYADLATTGFDVELGIVVGDASMLATVVSSPPPVGDAQGHSYSTAPAIDDNGTVAFAVGHSGGWQGAGVFTGSGGPLTTVISDASFPGAFNLAMNRSGVVAYQWPIGGQPPLFLYDNGVTTPVATGGAVIFDFVDVNDSAIVVVSESHAIRTGDSGGLTSFVDTTGPFAEFEAVSISNMGSIAYLGIRADSIRGIYTGPDSSLDKVIEVGDALDGSTVSDLNYGRDGLNDLGQVAFWARLADGRQGVYIATAVPEPASGFLLAASVGALLLFHRFRRLA
jgi:hypothetical protein